jgi:uncharacterized protein involved in exopolysaccharide biosynthesis
VAVSLPALWKASGTEPRFTSTAIILLEHSADNYPIFREWVPQNSAPILMTLLRSRSVAEEVVETLPKASFEELLTHRDERDYASRLMNLYGRLRGRPLAEVSPKQLVIQELQRARVSFGSRGGGLVEIQASASSPQVAVDVVGAYVEVLQGRTRAMNRDQARALREFMEGTQANVSATLKEAEAALADFRKQRGILQPDPNSQMDLVRLAQSEDALAEVQINEKMVQTRLAFVRGALAREAQEPAKAKAESAEVRSLQGRVARLERRHEELLDRYTESHPLVRTTKADLDDARAALEAHQNRPGKREAPDPQAQPDRRTLTQQAANMEAELSSLQVRKQTLQGQIQAAKARVTHLSTDELEYARLKRAADIQRNMFTMLQEKIYAANARGQGEVRSVRVIEPPIFPLASSSAQSLKVALFGLVVAGLMGVGVALGLDYMEDSVRSEAELEALVGVPVLGAITRMSVPKALPEPKRALRLPSGGQS